jgi:hypothetical protein
MQAPGLLCYASESTGQKRSNVKHHLFIVAFLTSSERRRFVPGKHGLPDG